MHATILVVEDEPDVRELITIYLEGEGYVVISAANGMAALDLLAKQSVDLILLDVMLPDLDGVEICKQIRAQSKIPILMLSAKSRDVDKIYGLNMGADDYLAKPFNPLELIARVRSQLRRSDLLCSKEAEGFYQIGDLSLDIPQHRVAKNGVEVYLTPKEFAIFELLAQYRGQVFSIKRIYEVVWGEDSFAQTENTIMVHIRKLREKLEDDASKPQYIKTVWGVGYKIDK